MLRKALERKGPPIRAHGHHLCMDNVGGVAPVRSQPGHRRRRTGPDQHRQPQHDPDPAQSPPPQDRQQKTGKAHKQGGVRCAGHLRLGPGQVGEQMPHGKDALRAPTRQPQGRVQQHRPDPAGLQDRRHRDRRHDHRAGQEVREEVRRCSVERRAVEVLDRERTGGQTRDGGHDGEGQQGVANRLNAPDGPRRRHGRVPDRSPAFCHRHQGPGGAERHLEAGLHDPFRLQDKNDQRCDGQGVKADRPAIGQACQEGHGGGHRRPPRRRVRTGQGEIDPHGQEAAQGRQLVPGQAQRQGRHGRHRQTDGGIDKAADGRHVQPGNRQHVRQARAPQVVLRLLRQPGFVTGGQRRHQSGRGPPGPAQPVQGVCQTGGETPSPLVQARLRRIQPPQVPTG